MADPPRQSADEVLEQARRQFLSAARGTLDAFEQFGTQLSSQPDAEQLLTPLRRELHRLNGSAATFGFPRVGRMAAALESAVRKWVADPQLDRDKRGTVITGFAHALRAELARDSVAPTLPRRRLLVVGLKDAVAVPLTTEAGARGYQVERVAGDELDEALDDGVPHAIIAADSVAGLESIKGVARLALRKRDSGIATGLTDAGVHVLDVRTEASEVLDALEALAVAARDERGGVLAVDDDPVMRTILQVACEHMNLSITVTAAPAAFREALANSDPELLVIDVDLGATSGLELARDVRGMDEFARTPILVLSGHADAATRDTAFATGADDYMLKPFAPAEFQRRVNALLEAQRRRLASTGIHTPSGVSLPARTFRDFDAELAARPREACCVAIASPAVAPASARELAAWHHECSRLATTAKESRGAAGLLDDTTLGLILDGTPIAAVAWLAAQRPNAPVGAPAWVAGVVGAAARGADATLVSLIAAAREARLAAADSGSVAREWDSADADIAPDVVVVEDDAALADLIVFALDTKGLSHRHFADGVVALQGLSAMRVRGQRPIVLLDVDLPGLDGHSLHEELCVQRPGMFEFVFLSALGSEAEQLRALQAGALDYLVKPVSLRVLTAKLATWRTRGRPA